MQQIEILDCTLRDGGYINNWDFGYNHIKLIKNNLVKSGVEYIELGYYTETKNTDDDKSLYSNLIELNNTLESNIKYLVMINYGEVNIDNIPEAYSVENIFGIRVCFHKKNMQEALEYCHRLIEKGYNVFVQPMVTMNYSDDEFNSLIDIVNSINPYAIYIADSFGSMKEEDVVIKFAQIDKKVKKNIKIGFHSHNNLQLSYSNVLTLLKMDLDRHVLLDSSIYGIGRGAGNLNTELIMEYLNRKMNKTYDIAPLLEVVDEYLIKLKAKHNWGYSLEFYLSAVANCHPNYSKHFMEKNTISTYELKELISLISDAKKAQFDKNYAESLYYDYMEIEFDDSFSYEKLKTLISDKNVILIGSGKSSLNYRKSANDNSFVIAVNNNTSNFNVDAIFLTNKKKYKKIDCNSKLLITSNIINEEDSIIFDYKRNIASELADKTDNALLMILNILQKVGIKEVKLIGFDGFAYNEENHYDDEYSYYVSEETIRKNNDVISQYLELYGNNIDIEFLTPSVYQKTRRNI